MVELRWTVRTYVPLAASGLADSTAWRNACRFSASASGVKLALPIGAWTTPVLSERNSIWPAFSARTMDAMSTPTVPDFGFGSKPRGPSTRPSFEPTMPIMSGLATTASNSNQPPATFSTSSCAPTWSAPAASASAALSPWANASTRTVRVLAFTQGDKATEAEAAGADHVGGQELIEKVAGGWFEFDAVVATPDMMAAVGSKLGRVLGPRGMLPNPKSGTVGIDIAAIVRALKAGQIEFRSDKTGVVHAPIGKASFTPEALTENLAALRQAVESAKPDAAKGTYLRTVYLSSTMGPSVRVTL